MDIFTNPPVIWFLIGLFFLVLELIIPGLIILFFGVGACLTSLVTWAFEPSVDIQIIVFIITSVIGLFVLRKYLKKALLKSGETKQKVSIESEFIGKHAIADCDFDANHTGKIIFKGAPWSARCDVAITKGQEVEIIDKDSITLIIKPLN